MVNKEEELKTNDTQISNKKASKTKGQKRIIPVAKKKNDTNHGEDEIYYDSHTDINETTEKKEKTKKQTPIVDHESHESTEQCKNDYFSQKTDFFILWNRIEIIVLLKF